MKTPETREALLNIINGMDHRERICIDLPKSTRLELGKNAYLIEIYVTYPWETARGLSGLDENRVLFTVARCDGKWEKGMARTSGKRIDLSTQRGVFKKVCELLQIQT
jgi:hypothetical protein